MLADRETARQTHTQTDRQADRNTQPTIPGRSNQLTGQMKVGFAESVLLNPLKCSGIKWLHLKLFIGIQV